MTSREFLVFRLSGPMCAFGEIAVGERRSVWSEPSKSAVLGLIAGALGWRRDQTDDHQRLEDELGFAVRVDAPGIPMRDYHTAQAPKARKGLSWATRRDELADRDNLNTVLSERAYRLEAVHTVALWQKDGCRPDLLHLAKALSLPQFAPSLGRKACPLGEPAFARVVTADSLHNALDQYDAVRAKRERALTPFRASPKTRLLSQRPVWFELGAGLAAEDGQADQTRQRRDALRHRGRREFNDRLEGRLKWRSDPLSGIVT